MIDRKETEKYHAFLKELVLQKSICIETCAWLQNSIIDFLYDILPLLIRYEKKLFTIEPVICELRKHAGDYKKQLRCQANRAIEIIDFLCKNQVLDVYDMKGGFADEPLIECMSEMATKGQAVCLITQDKNLEDSCMRINNLQVNRKANVEVYFLTPSGGLGTGIEVRANTTTPYDFRKSDKDYLKKAEKLSEADIFLSTECLKESFFARFVEYVIFLWEEMSNEAKNILWKVYISDSIIGESMGQYAEQDVCSSFRTLISKMNLEQLRDVAHIQIYETEGGMDSTSALISALRKNFFENKKTVCITQDLRIWIDVQYYINQIDKVKDNRAVNGSDIILYDIDSSGMLKTKFWGEYWKSKEPEKQYETALMLLGESNTLYEMSYPQLAVSKLKESCEQGYDKAIRKMAELIKEERVELKSKNELQWYFDILKNKEYPNEQYLIGSFFLQKNWSEEFFNMAKQWLRLAVKNGSWEAMEEIIHIHEIEKRYRKGKKEGNRENNQFEQIEAEFSNALSLIENGKTLEERNRGIHLLEWCASKGYAEANSIMGDIWYYGICEEKDEQKAYGYYLEAALENHAPSQMHVGKILLEQGHEKKNDRLAFINLLTAAEQGNRKAMYYLGYCYFKGYGCEKNDSLSVKWLQDADDEMRPQADYILGDIYYWGLHNVKGDIEKAKQYYESASEGGNKKASRQLQAIYFRGLENEYEEYLSQCFYYDEHGYENASYKLGTIYLYGKCGKRINIPKAIYYFERAAKEIPEASAKLGEVYYSDFYGVTDFEKSRKYYQQAYEKQVKIEYRNLAKMLYHGLGGEKDVQAAIHCLLKEQDNGDALFDLYEIYHAMNTNGNYDLQVKNYCSRAAEKGNEKARKLLKNEEKETWQ